MSRLHLLWNRLLYTLWFVPALVVLASIGVAAAMIELSGVLDPVVLARWPGVFGAGAEGSRDMLAAIAASMITVAGVTFSITTLAVTQASSQYTPRILPNFMRDRPSQLVLGGLTGVFAYCMIVLRTIGAGTPAASVPAIAVTVAFLLAGVGVALLIWFVHHIATALQVATVVRRLSEDTLQAIDVLFPSQLGDPDPDDEAGGADDASALAWHPVPSPHSGYLQAVDPAVLLDAAVAHRIVVRMERAVGDFVGMGTPLASVGTAGGAPESAAVRAVARAYLFGPYRTVEQDPGFGVRQLADVAVKALSAAINDPTTALNCIDYLGAVLARAAARRGEAARRQVDGELRVIARGPTFASLVDSAFDEIRRYAEGHMAVLIRQVDTLEVIGSATRNAGRRRHLLRHLDLLAEAAERTIPAPADRAALLARTEEVRTALGGGA